MYQIIENYIDQIITRSTPDKPLWDLENIQHGAKPRWNYIDGCILTGLLNLYEHTQDKKYLEFADNFIDYYIYDDGKIRGYDLKTYNIDNISGGRNLFDLYKITGKGKYKKAINLLYSQLKSQPRIEIGNFWHKLIYPNQIWLDGLYMGQVFYTRYETEFNRSKNYSDIVNQFCNVRKYMFDENKKLYYHGFDYSKKIFWANEKGLSQSFWLRAMGWYVIALIDTINYLDFSAIEEANILKKIFCEAIEGIISYIDTDSKMFYQVIDQKDKSGNYLETSGSAMIAYAVLKGVRLNVLEAKYQLIGKEIFDGICKKYLSENNGNIDLGGICLVAGLGPFDNLRRNGTYEYYISEPVVKNDAKGLGPFLMAYTEIRKQYNLQ